MLDTDAKTLKENLYSWNKFASVVYVEAPAGIGFSYVTDGDDGVYNDNRTSAENYEALKQFFARYPEFRKNKVFVAGESYGGIYAPTLAARILEGQHEFFVNLV
ncbi:Protein F41C3.5, partial [Aphelenchoides avenae]